MKKHSLLVITLLTILSFNIQAQEKDVLKSKNIFFIEGGVPFSYKGEKSYWENPNGTMAIMLPIALIKYTHQTSINFQASIGFKYYSVFYATGKPDYYSKWKSSNLFIGVGYNFYLTNNLSLVPSVYCGIAKANFNAGKNDSYYMPPIGIDGYSIKIEDEYLFYFNPEFAIDYRSFNSIHFRLSVGYDNYFINKTNILEPEATIFNFQSFDIKFGVGYAF
ncbi:MAG: hypothetical protein WC135_01540 [Bacteroidales bacterium]